MPPKSLAGERRSQSSKRLVAENRCRSPWGLLEHLKALLCKSPHTHSGLFLGRVTSGAPLRAPAAPAAPCCHCGRHQGSAAAVLLSQNCRSSQKGWVSGEHSLQVAVQLLPARSGRRRFRPEPTGAQKPQGALGDVAELRSGKSCSAAPGGSCILPSSAPRAAEVRRAHTAALRG